MAQSRSINITRMVVRNANYRIPPQAYLVQRCYLHTRDITGVDGIAVLSLGEGPRNLCVNKLCRWLLCTIELPRDRDIRVNRFEVSQTTLIVHLRQVTKLGDPE
jgi:hypothetical protein